MQETKLKYTVIKSREQYDAYCDTYWSIVTNESINHRPEVMDELDLLYLLIETYDEKTWPKRDIHPIELLKGLMEDHQLNSRELAAILGVSKSLVSSILHGRRALSKRNIRILAKRFAMREEAFSKPYALIK